MSTNYLSASTSTTCSYKYTPTTFFSSGVSACSCKSRIRKPITLICVNSQSLLYRRSKGLRFCKERPYKDRIFIAATMVSSDISIAEHSEEEEKENPLPLVESEINSKPRRIALFVEPSPFAYVSGYKNRFQNFIKYLREMGDEVMVVTTHEGVPQEFHGAQIIGSRSFPCPLYEKVPLSLALSPRIISAVAQFKPDIIHASSPGIMVFGALAIAKLLSVPIVMSYHTHVPVYIPRYTFSWLVKPMWLIIKFLHRAADLTLVPSAAIGKDLEAENVTTANRIRLWTKGVDSESFHPRFRSHEMRLRLSNGEPDRPLIVHVGRIGVEKSLDFLKRVMDRLPEARIAFIGDGPYREELEKLFSGMPAVFTGTLQGEELSQAYASGDVFVMPSESETLGLVVLEAMSSGLPVVAARAGGIPDIIPEEQQGKTGYLFNPEDIDDCLSKLKPLLYERELRETIGKAARVEMEKYDWRAATRKIRNEQYRDAILFWRKQREEFLKPFQWLIQRFSKNTPAAIEMRVDEIVGDWGGVLGRRGGEGRRRSGECAGVVERGGGCGVVHRHPWGVHESRRRHDVLAGVPIGGQDCGGCLPRGDHDRAGFERLYVGGVHVDDGQIVAGDFEEEFFVECSVDQAEELRKDNW